MTMASNLIIIDDDNWKDHVQTTLNGEVMGTGLVERDYERQPLCASPGAYSAIDMPLIPRSEWSARIKEMEETKSRLSDIRRTGNNGKPIPSLNQGRSNYCWIHSVVGTVQIQRAVMGLPYKKLAAFAAGCKIMNFRNEGGWSPLGMEFVVKNGLPEERLWPEGSFSRSNDKPETWENAKLYQVTEGWWDLSQRHYDRNLTFDQVMTLLLTRTPCTLDYNWWGHSVFGLDPVEVERNSFGIRGLNSWGDSYGDMGEFILRGNRAIPDGSVAPRVVDASVLAA